ncbi:MAG: tetratricopeptide repeat protein, partial [Chloroflexota bacterium]
EEARRIHGAHRDYYLWLAEEASNALLTQEHTNWLERLQADDDNLRAALEWSRGQPDEAEALARLVTALKDYWAYTGRFSEGRRWAAEALADRERVSSHYRIRMLFTAGRLALELGDYEEATTLLDESLALARREGDVRGEAEGLSNLGYVVQAHGDTGAAIALHTEALAQWRALAACRREKGSPFDGWYTREHE